MPPPSARPTRRAAPQEASHDEPRPRAASPAALVADGKGILAADESVATLTRRFDALKIKSTEQSRRQYREMLFTTPGVAAFISGVILYDETIRQKSSSGTLLAQVLDQPGHRARHQGRYRRQARSPAAPGELVTEGLDGLRDRLAEYRGMGARFAKWRAVISIGDTLPSARCVSVNAHALARYARALPGGRPRADHRARGADGRRARHRALRGSHGRGPARRVR